MIPNLPSAFLRQPIAHRALHDLSAGRPENSRAAVQAAIDRGYGIEIDIQPSVDGVAMVFHDYELDRLTAEQGAIAERSAADLKKIQLKGGDEGIPTLADILELVAGQVPLLIEIKDQDGAMGPMVGALEEAVAQQVAGYDGPVAVMSFNPHSIRHMQELLPDVPRGLVTSAYDPADWPLPAEVCDQLREISDYLTCGCCFISHEARDLGRERVAELKSTGAALLCWTIKTREAEAEARRIADNITFEQYLAELPA